MDEDSADARGANRTAAREGCGAGARGLRFHLVELMEVDLTKMNETGEWRRREAGATAVVKLGVAIRADVA